MSTIEQLKKWIDEAEAIVIGGGAGLSASAGFEYGGDNFLKHFKYMNELYGYEDMYSACFHSFKSSEEMWAYWSKFVYLNRYANGALPLYKKLFNLVKNKDYFVITTNVDHQFQKAGFDKKRLFYTQGDYGLFQCSKPCHKKTYDNYDMIIKMMNEQNEHKIPSSLIPKCPKCGAPMSMNLRSDNKFVEDDGWNEANKRYVKFLNDNDGKTILFLELGVGWNTPGIIKFPFMKMTYQMPKSHYVCINKGFNQIYDEIKDQSIILNRDILEIVDEIENIK